MGEKFIRALEHPETDAKIDLLEVWAYYGRWRLLRRARLDAQGREETGIEVVAMIVGGAVGLLVSYSEHQLSVTSICAAAGAAAGSFLAIIAAIWLKTFLETPAVLDKAERDRCEKLQKEKRENTVFVRTPETCHVSPKETIGSEVKCYAFYLRDIAMVNRSRLNAVLSARLFYRLPCVDGTEREGSFQLFVPNVDDGVLIEVPGGTPVKFRLQGQLRNDDGAFAAIPQELDQGRLRLELTDCVHQDTTKYIIPLGSDYTFTHF